jgi:hypothetical protein
VLGLQLQGTDRGAHALLLARLAGDALALFALALALPSALRAQAS